jgi:hypothetical protein
MVAVNAHNGLSGRSILLDEILDMIKSLFFMAALLAPGLAYGGDPSADLSVQIVLVRTAPSTQCPSTAPAEAQVAGFTTMVVCEDFTQQIPNTAGTGLTANWNGCASGPGPMSPSGQVWKITSPNAYQPGGDGGIGCPSMVQEADAMVPGQLVMHIHVLRSQWHATSTNSGGFAMATDDTSSHITGAGKYWSFPQASLIEITTRDNIDSLANPNSRPPGLCDNSAAQNLATSTHESVQGTGFNEKDIFEHWNAGDNLGQCVPYNADAALHNWNSGNRFANGLWDMATGDFGATLPPGMSRNPTWWVNYHTYGILTTTNGGWPLESCAYIDHLLVNCEQFPGGQAWQCSLTGSDGNVAKSPGNANGSGCYGERDFVYWILGSFGPQMAGDLHAYIQSFRVWSCPAWNAGGKPNVSVPGTNTCSGTLITH